MRSSVGGLKTSSLIDGHVHNDGAFLHAGDHVAPHHARGRGAGNEHRTHHQIGLPHGIAHCMDVGRHGQHLAIVNIVQLAKPVEILVDDGYMGTHANGNLSGIVSHHSAANNDHVRRRYTGHAAQQNAAPAIGTLQVLRSYLHGHAPGNFAHRSEKWKGIVLFANGFIGDRAHPALE